MILTQYRYYQMQQRNNTDAVVVMRSGEAYYVLGEKAGVVFPVIKDALTHKHAGAMYCYDTENYSYRSLSWGKHNLYLVMPVLVEAGFRVVLTDFNYAFKEAGGWEEVERIIKKHEERMDTEAKRHRQPVQLSLFDEWFS